MATIEARGICKTFNTTATEVRALTDVSLSFEQGAFAIIKGPSGSGKTTLLSVLGCLLSPTSGEVTILDRKVDALSQKELRSLRLNKIGFIFQTFNLLAALTATENVAMAGQLCGKPRLESLKTAEAVLGRVGLEQRVSFLPKNLSQGEKQRVAIARAFMNDPDIIIADEPTANLDSKTGKAIISMIRELGGNKTVVIATHDERIVEMADNVFLMEDGRIVGT